MTEAEAEMLVLKAALEWREARMRYLPPLSDIQGKAEQQHGEETHMNKHELAAKLSDSASMSKADAARFIGHVFGHIIDALARGREVRLDGFGTFARHHRPAGVARNPRTGEPVQVAAKDVPKFRPAKAFTDALNG